MKSSVFNIICIFFTGLTFGEKVEIRRTVTVDHVDSAEWIDFGFFNLYRFSADLPKLEVSLHWNGLGAEIVENPSTAGFDFQYWFDAFFEVQGLIDDHEKFMVETTQREVIDEFVYLPAMAESRQLFAHQGQETMEVADTTAVMARPVRIRVRATQLFRGGTEALSQLDGFDSLEIEVILRFHTQTPSSLNPSFSVPLENRGPGNGSLYFLSRKGLGYRILRINDADESEEVLIIPGTGVDFKFTFEELGFTEPKEIFWVEEYLLSQN